MTQWSQRELQKKAAKEEIYPVQGCGTSDTGSKKGGNNKEKELIFPILTSPMGELQVSEPADAAEYDEWEDEREWLQTQ